MHTRFTTHNTACVMLLVATTAVPTRALASRTPTEGAQPADPDAQPTSPDAFEPSVRIQISSRLGENNDAVQTEVLERLTKVAEEEGVVVDEDAEQLLYLIVKRENDGEATYHVQLAYTNMGSESLQREPDFECKGCGAELLLEKIAEQARPVFERFKQPAEPEPEASQPLRQQPDVAPTPTAREPDGPPQGIWMWGPGVALTGLGASAALGGAVGLTISNAQKDFQGNPTASWGALGVGLAALGVGIPLLILGEKRMRQRRRPRASAMYNGRTLTLGLHGAF